MFKFSRALIRVSKSSGVFNRLNYSTASAELKNAETNRVSRSSTNNIVAAAFASLNMEPQTSASDIKTPFTDGKIEKAKTVDELLSVSNGNGVSRKTALKVVSILAEWSTSNKIKLSDFESDPRFIRLCKVLTKPSGVAASSSAAAAAGKNVRLNLVQRSEDLSTIMNVTADDEAAKLVASITLPQMVKVMQTLASKKRRSTTLLRSLSYNITCCKDTLNLKQCSDLLFSMCVLNFPDENLLTRIGADIIKGLNEDFRKSAVIGSIITSIGLLKYKETDGLLDSLCNWMMANQELMRPPDGFALFLTMAVLDSKPSNAEELFDKLIPQLTTTEAPKPSVWLDFVWSLVLLKKATHEHISSVLSDSFISEVQNEKSLSKSSEMKLLNINAAAKTLSSEYAGPCIPDDSDLLKVEPPRSKDKDALVNSMLDSLKSLVQSENYIRSNVNTGMGFYIDAECVIDKKCNPVSFDKYEKSPEDYIKVAFLADDYNDMCRGRVELTGVNVLAGRLLESKGYRIIHVPHSEYKIRDKLVNRVQCLEAKIKALQQHH